MNFCHQVFFAGMAIIRESSVFPSLARAFSGRIVLKRVGSTPLDWGPVLLFWSDRSLYHNNDYAEDIRVCGLLVEVWIALSSFCRSWSKLIPWNKNARRKRLTILTLAKTHTPPFQWRYLSKTSCKMVNVLPVTIQWILQTLVMILLTI